MGCKQSPAIACRFDSALLRLLRDESEAFQGVPIENTWRSKLRGTKYEHLLGHGRVLMGSDGTPAALTWGFIDDFYTHAATKEKAIKATDDFMDLLLRVGLIAMKVKCKPPARQQKHCGLICDAASAPCLRVPRDKRDRALAMLKFLRSQPIVSRLALAVVTGVLQSLVEATPQRIGHTFLRRVYEGIHEPDDLPSADRKAFYYSVVDMTSEMWLDLEWWERVLQTDVAATARSGDTGSMVLTWGDGSGTGTGGTFQDLEETDMCPEADPDMEMWMGTWHPTVHHFSSNWKELRTELCVLERERRSGRLYNKTVFYFTDNITSYCVTNNGSSTSPSLHALLRKIKLLEMELNCRLEVVHVPGLLMIQQQTDGLSRGVWASVSRLAASPIEETARVFDPAPFSNAVAQWMMRKANLPSMPCVLMEHLASWHPNRFLHRLSLWLPPPEIARQALSHYLLSWMESSLDSAALFLIPRVLQRDWGTLSRHVTDLGVFCAADIPFPCRPSSHMPFVLLYVAPYVRQLDPVRVESTSRPKFARWHQQQADHVRGLS